MDYHAFCTDLDGTFLSLKNDVSDFSVSQINRIKDQFPIILASARMPQSMEWLQNRLNIQGHPMICYNGALIYKEGRYTELGSITTQQTHDIADLCQSHKVAVGLYHKNNWYVPKDSVRVQKEIYNTRTTPVIAATATTLVNHGNLGWHKLMLMGTQETIDILAPLLEKKWGAILQIYRSNDTLIEIAPAQISKLIALQKVLNKKDLTKVIAFGDNYNDIEMIQAVGHGIAVANGREALKAIAKEVCGSCAEDGVAHYLASHF